MSLPTSSTAADIAHSGRSSPIWRSVWSRIGDAEVDRDAGELYLSWRPSSDQATPRPCEETPGGHARKRGTMAESECAAELPGGSASRSRPHQSLSTVTAIGDRRAGFHQPLQSRRRRGHFGCLERIPFPVRNLRHPVLNGPQDDRPVSCQSLEGKP